MFIWAPVGLNLGWFIFIIFTVSSWSFKTDFWISPKSNKTNGFLHIFARGALSADAMCRAAGAKMCAKMLKSNGNISFFAFSFGPLLAPTWAGSFSSFLQVSSWSFKTEFWKSPKINKTNGFLTIFARGACSADAMCRAAFAKRCAKVLKKSKEI